MLDPDGERIAEAEERDDGNRGDENACSNECEWVTLEREFLSECGHLNQDWKDENEAVCCNNCHNLGCRTWGVEMAE